MYGLRVTLKPCQPTRSCPTRPAPVTDRHTIGAVAWHRHFTLSAGKYLIGHRQALGGVRKASCRSQRHDAANTVAVITMALVATTAGMSGQMTWGNGACGQRP
jgi:hypothetical protein